VTHGRENVFVEFVGETGGLCGGRGAGSEVRAFMGEVAARDFGVSAWSATGFAPFRYCVERLVHDGGLGTAFDSIGVVHGGQHEGSSLGRARSGRCKESEGMGRVE